MRLRSFVIQCVIKFLTNQLNLLSQMYIFHFKLLQNTFIQEVDKFQQLLSATEEWLYDEGEDAEKPIYDKRLSELKSTIEAPIFERYQKKVQEEERVRREAEEKVRKEAEEKARIEAEVKKFAEEMQVDETGEGQGQQPQDVTKEKSPKTKKQKEKGIIDIF